MIEKIFNEHIKIIKKIKKMAPTIKKISNCIKKALKKGNKILICGNGGSAADAQHFAAELVGRYKKDRAALAAMALTTDTSIITAVGNDYGFEKIFSRQIEALGKKGDVLLVISTSGNSPNIIKAIETAKNKKMKIICLLGKDGGKVKGKSKMEIIIPSNETPRVQEAHEIILHTICELICENT